MNLNADEIKTHLLNHYGFKDIPKPNGDSLIKVYRLQHKALPHYLHIKLDSKTDLLALPLIHTYTDKKQNALSIYGVTAGSIYNSSAFKQYPDLDSNQPSKQKPGLCFDFDHTDALDAFMTLMFSMKLEAGPVSQFTDPIATTPTEQMALTKVRLGQSKYRQNLIDYWGGCSITGFTNEKLLVASHIRPWHDEELTRLDVFNGLLLTPNLDAAFDKGYISFRNDRSIIISSRLSELDCKHLGLSPSMKLRMIDEKHKDYLDWHRKNHGFES